MSQWLCRKFIKSCYTTTKITLGPVKTLHRVGILYTKQGLKLVLSIGCSNIDGIWGDWPASKPEGVWMDILNIEANTQQIKSFVWGWTSLDHISNNCKKAQHGWSILAQSLCSTWDFALFYLNRQIRAEGWYK